MSFMLDDQTIAKMAERAEKCISTPGYRSRSSDQHVIENAIRVALMEQAQKLIEVLPASALSSSILNLVK